MDTSLDRFTCSHRSWCRHAAFLRACLSTSLTFRKCMEIYGKCMEMCFPSHIRMLSRARLSDLFSPFALDFDNQVNLDSCFALLPKMRAGKAITVLKTWANSWVTCHRSHDQTILPRLRGCKAHSDLLIHYFQCLHMCMYALMKFFYRSYDSVSEGSSLP